MRRRRVFRMMTVHTPARFCVHVNVESIVWDQGVSYCCISPSRLVALQGSFFPLFSIFLWRMFQMLFLCNEADGSILTALTDCLHGNQATPILITSVPSPPRLPWHLAGTGLESLILRLSLSVAWGALSLTAWKRDQERKWLPFHPQCWF